MRIIKILICTVFLASIALISSCKKEKSEASTENVLPSSEQFITFKIDGQVYTFEDAGIPEDNYFNPATGGKIVFTFKGKDGISSLRLNANYFGDLSEPFVAFTHTGSPPPANASFKFIDSDGKEYTSVIDTKPISSMNVSPLSNDFIEGTFTLNLFLDGDDTKSQKLITNGNFKVKLLKL